MLNETLKVQLSVLALFVLTPDVMAQSTPGSVTNLSGSATTGNAASLNQQTNLGGNNTSELPSNQGRAWYIKPRINLTETLTDNSNLNTSQNSKEGDLITQISPGVLIDGKSARIKGHLDYALNAQIYAKSNNTRTQNSLNSFGTLEAVENWLFVDVSGVIAQQAISAFGTQSPSNGSINNNSTETSTYRVSPYIQGKFAGWTDYTLRYNRSTTRSTASSASNIDLTEWTGGMKGSTYFQNLRWALDGSQQTADYSSGRETDASKFAAKLTYALTSQFSVSGSGGWEENNYASLDQERRTTHGYGFDWSPTERTQISAFKERRFFGDGHNISLSHRFPLSSIRYTDTRDVSILPNQFSSVGLGSVFDIYYDQFASLVPDPVQRANFVNALLAQNGINPNTQVTSSFLSSRASIQRRQQLTLILQGARNSLTFLVNRNLSQSTLAAAATTDDFSQASEIRQQGYSINFSHKVSELSNLNALLSRQESTGNGSVNLKTTTNLYQVNLSSKLGAKTSGSLSLRHTESDGASSFKENAIIGTVSFIY
jgi:uncharacterized protein (PEP-CTERM system associated)